jgi:hypothetical protein
MVPRMYRSRFIVLPPRFLDGVDAVAQEVAQSTRRTCSRNSTALRSEINLLAPPRWTLNFHMHRLDEELRLAARMQQDFLPKSLPQVGPVRFHTLFRPAGYVSGDLYDVMRLDERTSASISPMPSATACPRRC